MAQIDNIGDLLSIAMSRTGAHIVIAPDSVRAEKPAKNFGDDYGHGYAERHSGIGWDAVTRGDLLGSGSNPYRIFQISIRCTPEAYLAALRGEAEYKWRAVSGYVPIPADLIEWAEARGSFPANWPKIADVRAAAVELSSTDYD